MYFSLINKYFILLVELFYVQSDYASETIIHNTMKWYNRVVMLLMYFVNKFYIIALWVKSVQKGLALKYHSYSETSSIISYYIIKHKISNVIWFCGIKQVTTSFCENLISDIYTTESHRPHWLLAKPRVNTNRRWIIYRILF